MEDKKIVTLAEVKDILTERQKDGELTAEQKLAMEHTQRFARMDSKKAKKLVKELTELGFVSEINAVKRADRPSARSSPSRRSPSPSSSA